MSLVLEGILPPVVTPFRRDGSLDLAAFESNLEAYASADLAGVLVLGSNGEASSLEDEEKKALVGIARARVGERRRLLVGTGLESTRATIALTRRVADLGADAVLVLTPSYYKSQMTVDALRAHFEAVAEASPVPVLLYSVPQSTGIPFTTALASAVAEHPNIAGVKESSGDLGLMGRLIASCPSSFAVVCGSAPVLYPALCLGAVGGILAVACCAPGPTTALFRAFERGDHEHARRLQSVIAPLATAVTATWGVAGLKLAMDAAGLRGGAVRAPLIPPPPGARAELERFLADAHAAV